MTDSKSVTNNPQKINNVTDKAEYVTSQYVCPPPDYWRGCSVMGRPEGARLCDV